MGSGSSGGTALTTVMIEFRVLTILSLNRSLKQLELGTLPVRLFRNVNPAAGRFGTNLPIQVEFSLKATISLQAGREGRKTREPNRLRCSWRRPQQCDPKQNLREGFWAQCFQEKDT